MENARARAAKAETRRHAVSRGGTFYEKVAPTRSGAADAPITIASYPGELAIIDGGLRGFAESPATSWEPFAGGAEGEFVSTKTYPDTDARRAPMQFLPASWEPMWGIEDERPLSLGHFADSMVPLHGYRFAADLRARNEFWLRAKRGEAKKGEGDTALYGGPVWSVMHVYHNTVLRATPTFRNYFLFGLGAQGLRNTERDVFNNIFVQMDKVPGAGFAGIREPGNLREGGNILWGVKDGAAVTAIRSRSSAHRRFSRRAKNPIRPAGRRVIA